MVLGISGGRTSGSPATAGAGENSGGKGLTYWEVVSKCDPRARELADRHYSRQKVGSRELGPPGQKILLLGKDGMAVWGSHRPAPWAKLERMDGFKGHSCFLFRNEGPVLSSLLIREAVALTAMEWGKDAFVTYVAAEKIRSVNPGACYIKAKFRRVGFRDKTKHGRMAKLIMDAEEVSTCVREFLLPLGSG